MRVLLTLAASAALLGAARAADCSGTEPCTSDCGDDCGGQACFFTLASTGCDGKTSNDAACAIAARTNGYTGGSMVCKTSDGNYVGTAATPVQCDSTNQLCGCAANQAVDAVSAIAATEVDVGTTKTSDKIMVAAGTAKTWAAAGYAQGDKIVIGGSGCAPLTGGNTDLVTTITKIDNLELTIAAAFPVAGNEDTSKQCTVKRVQSLKCTACAAGFVFASGDAAPQSGARVCTVKQCDSSNKQCGCGANKAIVADAANSNNFKCEACATGYAFATGDTSPQTSVRACAANQCTGNANPVTLPTNAEKSSDPFDNSDKINTGDDVLKGIQCKTGYTRTPSEGTNKALAVCASAGSNAVTVTGFSCKPTCKAISFGTAILGADSGGCSAGQKLVAGLAQDTTCALKCKAGYTAKNAATYTCAKGSSANADPVSPFECDINNCKKESGTRTGYACASATDKNACKDGPAFTGADDVSKLGTVTCAPGYGAGPKVTAAAAGNNPAVASCGGAAGSINTNFAFVGCHRHKCNDIAGKGDSSKASFAESNCAAGYKIKAGLDIFCETTTCASTDCCQDINECTEKDDPNKAPRVDTGAGAKVIHNCHTNAVCANGDSVVDSSCSDASKKSKSACTAINAGTGNAYGTWTEKNGNGGTPVAGSNGGSAGTKNTKFTCTCKDNYFGNGVSCTQCTAVANSVSVTCTTAKDSRAVCVTGSIKVPAASTTTSDVCRLECPFVDLMGMIDSLQPTCPSPGAADDAEASKTKCEAVPGCYYTKKDGAAAQTCKQLYVECKKLAASASACTSIATAPRLWGDVKLASDQAGNLTTTGCVFTAASAGGDAWDDSARCDITPAAIKVPKGTGSANYADTRTPTVRCQALLDTNWAHDLRGSCDATAKCPLHNSASNSPDGLVAKVKLIYANPPGSPPNLAATGHAYFTDGQADTKTTWETCSEIRDAVNAAPTCSSSG